MVCRIILLLAAASIAFSAHGGVSADNLNSIFSAVKGVAKSQEVASMSEEDEIAVGKEIAAQTLGSYPVVRDEKLQRYLNQVGLWVALQSPRPSLPWRFAAVESKQINAFAVPGGAVLVTRGMLNLVANEAELACVLGHEIGHVVRKHHLTLVQKEILLKTGSDVLSAQMQSGDMRKALVAQTGDLFARALDRGSESDADGDGVLYAARAGYDPDACLTFMKRMAGMKQDTGALQSLFKTHPRPADRVADVGNALGRLEGIEPGTGIRPKLGYKH